MKFPSMVYNRNGKELIPLKVFTINGQYILAMYQGCYPQ